MKKNTCPAVALAKWGVGLLLTGLVFVSNVVPAQALSIRPLETPPASLEQLRNTVTSILNQVNQLPSNTVEELQLKVNLLLSAVKLQTQVNDMIAAKNNTPRPVIYSLTPSSGPIGARVLVIGAGISAGDDVFFGTGDPFSNLPNATLSETHEGLGFNVPGFGPGCNPIFDNCSVVGANPIFPNTTNAVKIRKNNQYTQKAVSNDRYFYVTVDGVLEEDVTDNFPLPNPPHGLTATALSPTSVKLTWFNTNGMYSFKIVESIDNHKYDLGLSPEKSYIINNLTPGSTHQYAVSSCADATCYRASSPSSYVTVTLPTTVNSAPTTIFSPAGGETYVLGQSYKLEYALPSNGTWAFDFLSGSSGSTRVGGFNFGYLGHTTDAGAAGYHNMSAGLPIWATGSFNLSPGQYRLRLCKNNSANADDRTQLTNCTTSSVFTVANASTAASLSVTSPNSPVSRTSDLRIDYTTSGLGSMVYPVCSQSGVCPAPSYPDYSLYYYWDNNSNIPNDQKLSVSASGYITIPKEKFPTSNTATHTLTLAVFGSDGSLPMNSALTKVLSITFGGAGTATRALPVTNFTAVREGSNVRLGWSRSVGDTIGVQYVVYRSTVSGYPNTSGGGIHVPINQTTYFDNGSMFGTISPNTTYYYTIFTEGPGNAADNSGPVYATASAGSATSAGTFSVGVDSSAPSYQILAGGMDNVDANVLRFRPTGENISLTKIGVKLSSGSPLDLIDYTIWSGANKVGTGYFAGGSSVSTVTLSSPVTLTKDTDTTLKLKVDLAGVGPNEAGVSGDLIKLSWNDTDLSATQGVGLNSGTVISATVGNSYSPAGIRLFRGYPEVKLVDMPSSGLGGDGNLIRFKVTASNGGNGISLARLSFRIQTSGSNSSDPSFLTSTMQLKSYSDAAYSAMTDSVAVITSETLPKSGTFSMTATAVMTYSPIIIPAGQTRYFELYSPMTSPSNYGTVVTTLLADSTYAGPQILPSNVNNFIWSPNTNGNSTASSADWVNGYNLNGLPTSGHIQTRVVSGGSVMANPVISNVTVNKTSVRVGEQITVNWQSQNLASTENVSIQYTMTDCAECGALAPGQSLTYSQLTQTANTGAYTFAIPSSWQYMISSTYGYRLKVSPVSTGTSAEGGDFTVLPAVVVTPVAKTWQSSAAKWGPAYCNNNIADQKWPSGNTTYEGPKIEKCYTTASGQAVRQSMWEMTAADRNLAGQDCSAYATGLIVKTNVDPGYNYTCTETLTTGATSAVNNQMASMLNAMRSVLESLKASLNN